MYLIENIGNPANRSKTLLVLAKSSSKTELQLGQVMDIRVFRTLGTIHDVLHKSFQNRVFIALYCSRVDMDPSPGEKLETILGYYYILGVVQVVVEQLILNLAKKGTQYGELWVHFMLFFRVRVGSLEEPLLNSSFESYKLRVLTCRPASRWRIHHQHHECIAPAQESSLICSWQLIKGPVWNLFYSVFLFSHLKLRF